MRILVVEDEKDLNTILTKVFIKSGYQVDSCFNGDEAKYNIEQFEYDLVVSDIMMPVFNGLELLKWMRNRNYITPFLLLTAKDSINDKVTGLDMGADDYLIKPFNIDELLARVRALTRKNLTNKSNILYCGDLSLDSLKKEVFRDNEEIKLIPKEFIILEYLIKNKGIVISREKLENQIWSFDNFGSSNNIDVYISRIRKKIDTNFDKKLLHTIKGVGWLLKDE